MEIILANWESEQLINLCLKKKGFGIPSEQANA